MSDQPSEVDRTLENNLAAIARDLADIKDAVYGKPNIGWQGIISRVEDTEKRVASMKEIQDAFCRDRDRERKEQTELDKKRNRFYAFLLTTFGGVLTGIVIQLFILITTQGSPS